MAGEGGFAPSGAGPRDRAGDRGRGPRRHDFGIDFRGAARAVRPLLATLVLSLTVALQAFAADAIVASRIWPSEEYTRVTLEAAAAVRHEYFFVKDPERLVVDLEGVELNDELKGLPAKVREDDPYIKAIRVARNRTNVVRVVFDLKAAVKPSVFALPPAGEYKHRLVLDIYPEAPRDPLMALLDPKPDSIAMIGAAPMAPALEPPPAPTPPPASSAAPIDPPPPSALRPETVARVEVPPRADPSKAEAVKGAKPARLVIVAIDAGHGGEDPGARGRGGTHEKDITLAIAKRLKAKLDQEPNMRGVLVRDGDYYVGLAQRVGKARRVQADLFVSIHADAWIKPDVKGSSVFVLSERGATSAAARYLAQKENESDLIGGVNISTRDPVLARTLLDLSQTAQINDSLKLGKHVLGELGDVNALHKPAVEQAGFAVLKAPDIPSILVETAFISNPDEERRLKDPGYQDKMAAAISTGIKRYFAANPPLARSRLVESGSPPPGMAFTPRLVPPAPAAPAARGR